MVRIRMKSMGRKHRPFFRICAIDIHKPRDGREIEVLGTYDPLVPDTDARVTINHERVQHWLSVGAQPSENVKVLLKKYGPGGTNLDQHKAAREKLLANRSRRQPPAVAAKAEKTEKAE